MSQTPKDPTVQKAASSATGTANPTATTGPEAPLVHAVNVMKSVHGTEVPEGIDLDVRRGEVVCLLGPSGFGKTTSLRCINQLEAIDGGRIRVDGDLVGFRERDGHLHRLTDKEVATQPRDIGMLFQRFNLFPHTTALHVVFMDGGVVVEQGRPTDVLGNPQHQRTRSFLQRMRSDASSDPADLLAAAARAGQPPEPTDAT